jgi:hypothetical protein
MAGCGAATDSSSAGACLTVQGIPVSRVRGRPEGKGLTCWRISCRGSLRASTDLPGCDEIASSETVFRAQSKNLPQAKQQTRRRSIGTEQQGWLARLANKASALTAVVAPCRSLYFQRDRAADQTPNPNVCNQSHLANDLTACCQFCDAQRSVSGT